MSKTYTTVQGDQWDAIAYRALGSTDYTGLLMNANLKYRGTFVFPAGITLVLPELPGGGVTASKLIPPWKQEQAQAKGIQVK